MPLCLTLVTLLWGLVSPVLSDEACSHAGQRITTILNVITNAKDINTTSLMADHAKEFFSRYFAPNGAVADISGVYHINDTATLASQVMADLAANNTRLFYEITETEEIVIRGVRDAPVSVGSELRTEINANFTLQPATCLISSLSVTSHVGVIAQIQTGPNKKKKKSSSRHPLDIDPILTCIDNHYDTPANERQCSTEPRKRNLVVRKKGKISQYHDAIYGYLRGTQVSDNSPEPFITDLLQQVQNRLPPQISYRRAYTNDEWVSEKIWERLRYANSQKGLSLSSHGRWEPTFYAGHQDAQDCKIVAMSNIMGYVKTVLAQNNMRVFERCFIEKSKNDMWKSKNKSVSIDRAEVLDIWRRFEYRNWEAYLDAQHHMKYLAMERFNSFSGEMQDYRIIENLMRHIGFDPDQVNMIRQFVPQATQEEYVAELRKEIDAGSFLVVYFLVAPIPEHLHYGGVDLKKRRSYGWGYPVYESQYTVREHGAVITGYIDAVLKQGDGEQSVNETLSLVANHWGYKWLFQPTELYKSTSECRLNRSMDKSVQVGTLRRNIFRVRLNAEQQRCFDEL